MNTPARSSGCSLLVSNIMDSMPGLSQTKGNATETNAFLAICEIAMSCPPEWFSQEERLAIFTAVDTLYGHPTKFLADISDGSVSFVNKCGNLCNGRSTAEFVATLMRLHYEEVEKKV